LLFNANRTVVEEVEQTKKKFLNDNHFF
jgi:hypothetical protein